MYSRLLGRCIRRSLPCMQSNFARKLYVTVASAKKPDSTVSKMFPEYKVIYHVPYINLIAGVNRFKYHCGIAFAGILAVTPVLTMLDFITFETACMSFSLVIPAALCLCGFGTLTNSVGIVYFNEQNGKMIISYVDKWGNRVDLNTEVSEITPILDTWENKKGVVAKVLPYRLFRVSSVKKPMKLQRGYVVARKHFDNIFGESDV